MKCPVCRKLIDSPEIVRLERIETEVEEKVVAEGETQTRTSVFKGILHVMVCPECEVIVGGILIPIHHH